jgi:hypothetical protein
MARSLDQILTELHAVYQPQKDQYNQAITAVDPAQQAEEQGLQSAKTDAFSQIEQAANRRGIFYGGMPIAEEQRYTGQQFLPSVANLRSKYAQQKFDLTSALNKVTSDEYNQANGIHQNELDLEEKAREFDRQLAAQAAAARASGGAGGASPSFGSFGSPNVAGASAAASYTQNLVAASPSPTPTALQFQPLLIRSLQVSPSAHSCNRWPKRVIVALNRLLAMSATTTAITRIWSVLTPESTTL